MQERHHVKTHPNEPKAPEVVPHPVRKEPGGNVQTDDINIPILATFVAFFAVLLAVVIISLQAWFYGVQARERLAKTAPQESKGTELGDTLARQREQLTKAGMVYGLPPGATMPATTTGASAPAARKHISIDDAMTQVADRYKGGK